LWAPCPGKASRLAEQALREREAKIRGLFGANIIAIFIGDIEGQVSEANDAFFKMLGYDREDLASGRVHRTRITPPEWHDRDARTRVELETLGRIQPFEKECWRKDGSPVPVLIGAAVFQPDRVVAFALDLTERKRAEQALRESEEQWKAVFENNPTMYFMVDTSGAIVSVNPLGAEQLGFTVGRIDRASCARSLSRGGQRGRQEEYCHLLRTTRPNHELGGAQNSQEWRGALGARGGKGYVDQGPTRGADCVRGCYRA
jgi:PAS domain S-box-containing protein